MEQVVEVAPSVDVRRRVALAGKYLTRTAFLSIYWDLLTIVYHIFTNSLRKTTY